ncbi:hypothetical protein AB0A74_41875 [Saccharothrix sp. NPDC042600]|uniref:hypothetical protein n=1 Tax=Saccharothrix TaxID=2071 RepID=UPI0033CB97F1|nr:hypothetical protein GCM10017745_62060 [Saccharothrix mutabilis subsp. capreolus]
MNETDLVELLRERADFPDHGHRTRVEGVRAKVRRSRWRQAGAVAVAIVLVLGGVLVGLPRGQSPDPADHPRLPAYLDGYTFPTSVSAALPTKKANLYYTPKDETFRLHAYCLIGDRSSVGIRITVNDKVWYDGACPRIGTMIAPPRDAWTAFGIQFGRAVRIEATLPAPPADTGDWGFRVAEEVPLADYPFPPRPERLAVLPEDEPALARSNPEHPEGQFETRFRWAETGGLDLWLNSPGRVRVFVNGVEVLTATFWTYDLHTASTAPVAEWPRLHGLDLKPDEEVTLVVIPERTSGQWRVTRWPAPPR